MSIYSRPKSETCCKVCGKLFMAERWKVLKGKQMCCSKSCRGRIAVSFQEPKSRNLKHGGCVGGELSPLYSRWAAIKSRCHSESNVKYGRYGARGIRMCEEWRNSYPAFEKWSLENGFEPSLQIDRIDNSKGYDPSNCRWVTCMKNQSNRDRSIIFPSGETTAEVAKRLGLNPNSIRSRIDRGMPLEIAMVMPKIPNGYERKKFNINKWNPEWDR